MTPSLDLSIIIVSWNVRALLCECLTSIFASPIMTAAVAGHVPVEVIVIDSASSDGSAEAVAAAFSQVRLTTAADNIGFVRGNNLGLAQARGRYLLLLNPDTRVVGDALAQMLAYMDAHAEVGILGPHTLNSDGSTQSTRRRFPSVTVGLFESTWVQPYAPTGLLDHYYMRDTRDDQTTQVDWVQGSALLARRAVYEAIGGLDEGYAMYSEELDWCRRAADAGWKAVYFAGAQIIHHGGKSSDQAAARSQIEFHRSKLRYFRKFHGRGAAGLLRGWLLANYAVQSLIEGAKYLLGHKRPLRRQRLAAYAQVLRSGLQVH